MNRLPQTRPDGDDLIAPPADRYQGRIMRMFQLTRAL
jgi:hypothetical protein